jgi:hypothetical protein
MKNAKNSSQFSFNLKYSYQNLYNYNPEYLLMLKPCMNGKNGHTERIKRKGTNVKP